MSSVESFFRGDYMPHGHCYMWQPHILWTNVISDLAIAAAYFSLPVAIVMFTRKRRDIGYQSVFLLFSLFILFCGITHVIGVFTIWHGIYGWHGISKAATAIVSMATAMYVFKIIPHALAIPTPQQYSGIQEKLDKSEQQRSKLEERLEEQELTRFMLNAIPVSTVLLDAEYKIQLCNSHFYEEFDYQETELLGSDISKIVTLNLKADFKDCFNLAKGERKNVIGQLTNSSPKATPVELTLVESQYKGQTLKLLTLRDLTEIRQTKKELLSSHQRLERAINATEDGIWEWNVETGRVNYSKGLMQMIGQGRVKQPTFEHWQQHIHPDYVQKVENAIQTHFETQNRYEVEYLGKNAEGEYGWFYSVGNSIFNEENKPILMSGSLRYIHNAKLLESQVQEKTEYLEAIYRGTNQAIWVINVEANEEYRFLIYNETAAQRTATTVESVVGKTVSELAGNIFPEEVAERVQNNYATCAKSGDTLEYIEMIPMDDSDKWYQTSLYPIHDKNRQVRKIVGSAIDITGQKQFERDLENNQQFLEKMIDSAVCGLYLYDLRSNTNVRVNRRYTDILGYDLQDLQTQTEELSSLFHPEDTGKVIEHIQEVASSQHGELYPLTYRFRHKKGHWVWCYSVDTIIQYDSEYQPELMLGTFIDITEQTLLNIKLQQSNEYLERFAFIASHDLQEPLRKITSFSDILSQTLEGYLEDNEEAKYQFTRITEAAVRMRTMIKDLLKLSRINSAELDLTQVSLKQLLKSSQNDLQVASDEAGLEIDCQTPDSILVCDQALFGQVFMNLMSNTIKFASKGSLPRVIVSTKEVDGKWRITYSDNGIGIKEEYRNTIFEPFKRLHHREQFKGSGIGLAICAKIVDVHQGKIWCEGQEEPGACFVIEIPVRPVK